jgi:hypothetical protein
MFWGFYWLLFSSVSGTLICLSITPAAIFIAAATINRYEPMPKPQLIAMLPLELIASVYPPMSGDADIADAMSVTCCGIGCPPDMEPANDVIIPVNATMNISMIMIGISEVMPLIMYVFDRLFGFSTPMMSRAFSITLDRKMMLNGIPKPNSVVNP